MTTFRVFMTGSIDAEHDCDCDLCNAPRYKQIEAAFDAVIQAEDAEDAKGKAVVDICDKFDAARGYDVDTETAHITLHYIEEVGDLERVNYPMLPGIEGGMQ